MNRYQYGLRLGYHPLGCLSGLLVMLGWPLSGVCQITPDGTVSTQVTTLDSSNFVIEAGDQAGGNLFHSFEQFSVPAGGAAYFNQLPEIQNIFSRVTGNAISTIEGTIRANGTANLYLLNPAGLIFGPNATLDIGGSFVGTTAQSLRFADGTVFESQDRAIGPQLTISRPLGLRLTAQSGPITVLGNGHRLFSIPPNFETFRRFRRPGLQVDSTQTLALVGNNLTLQGGNLTTPGGRIELGSVAAGEVSLVNQGANLALGYRNVNDFQDIVFGQAASIDTAGSGGGDIQVQSRRIELTDGSAILSDTLGADPGGTLRIQATDSVSLGGLSPNGAFLTGIYADAGSTATARGSNLVLETGQLRVFDGGFISASTFGAGDSGDIILRADTLDAVGTFPNSLIPTGIVNQVLSGARGQGGNFLIEADRVSILDGAQVGSGTFGIGNSGDVTVNANLVEVVGTDASGLIFSGLFNQVAPGSLGGVGGDLTLNAGVIQVADLALIATSVAPGAIGTSGDLNINTTTLAISNGAQVTSATRGRGNAGDTRVRADSIEVYGVDFIGDTAINAGISATVGSNAMGDGGDIDIVAGEIVLRDEGSIFTITRGQGNAGNIDIEAREIVLVGSSSSVEGSSSFISTRTRTSNAAGDIRVSADSFTATEGAFVSVESDVTGASGNLDLSARQIRLTNGGALSAEAVAGDRGSINLQVGELLFLNNGGQITTSATGTATGGNINIDGGLIFLNQGSEIIAQAITGTGGNIQLTPLQLLQFESLIDASSDLGIDGSVTIERLTPEAEPSPVELTETILTPDQIVANSCLVAQNRTAGQFLISGSGGLSPVPSDAGLTTFETYAIPSVAEASAQIIAQGSVVNQPQDLSEMPVEEALGAYTLPDGRVLLARGCRIGA